MINLTQQIYNSRGALSVLKLSIMKDNSRPDWHCYDVEMLIAMCIINQKLM